MPHRQLIAWHMLTVAVLISLAVSWCRCDSSCSGMCPNIDETRCSCTVKPVIAGSSQSGNYVSCSGLGNLTAMPSFHCSSTISEFSIVGSYLTTLQRAAFSQVMAKSLWLTGLGVSDVDGEAFFGLDNVLQTISLGFNNIAFLAGNTFNRLNGLTSVVLEQNGLTELQPGLFRNLTKMVNINLQRNNIRTVSADAFDGLNNLQSLDMSDNYISELPANFLKSSNNVRSLFLAGNRLTNLISPGFNSMPNLTWLDLSRNMLSNLPSKMLPGCEKLMTLYLSSNNISSISSLAIVALVRLQVIDARSNKIEFIPFDAFRNASALKEVLFANNSIKQIDSGLFRSTSILQKLNLSQNYIQSIPADAFPDEGSTLKYFDVSRNNLTEASFLTRLPFLNTADFSYNRLTTLNFARAPYLLSLRATYNQLRSFGKRVLAQLPALRELYLDHNVIGYIEPGWLNDNNGILNLSLSHNALTDLPLLGGANLISARLNDNNIRNISDGAFAYSPSLSELYLQNNKIEYLTSSSFAGLGSLRILDLSNNSLRSLPQFAFQAMTRLEELLLANNGFSTIISDTFSGLPSLTTFDLAGNTLQTLTYETVSALLTSNHTALYLGFNPFVCSCDVLWIRESSLVKDVNTSICYANQVCYLLMCNPTKNCTHTVNPIYRDNDPLCVEPTPSFCRQTTEFSTTQTTISTASTTTSTTTNTISETSEISAFTDATNSSLIVRSFPDMISTLSTVGTPWGAVEQANGIKPYVYIIIGVVLGAAALAATAVALFCFIRRRSRNQDSLKQIGGYREGSNDEVGILTNCVTPDQSSELEDPLPPDWKTSDETGNAAFEVSDGDLASGFRPRPKGTVGLPYGHFRLPNSDSRRWRSGGLTDNSESSQPDYEEYSKTSEGDDCEESHVRKKRRNESEFVDGDPNYSEDGDFRFPSGLCGGLLWRGGQKEPYETEKLSKSSPTDADTHREKEQRPASVGGGRRSEFADDDENLTAPGLEEFRLPFKLGGDLLWRGGEKGPYASAKFPKDYSKDSEEPSADEVNAPAKRRRGRETEFIDEDENLSPSICAPDDFRFPAGFAEGLLWRGAKKEPYEAEKLPRDFNSEADNETEPKKQKLSKSPGGPRRSVFTSEEENLPSPSSDGYRLPSKTGADLLWRDTAQRGPYVSTKLSKGYVGDEISVDPSGKKVRKAGRHRASSASEFIDSTSETYATANFRFPSSTSGSDIVWRAGQKRPYSTAKLPKDYCSSDITDYEAASKTQRRRRRKSIESEFVDLDRNSSLCASSVAGFRIPGTTGTAVPHSLKWRNSRLVERPTSLKMAGHDRVSLDSKQEKTRKNGNRESVFEWEARSDVCEPHGSSFGDFKTGPVKPPSNFHWKFDRFANALTLTSDLSPTEGTSLQRNSGSDVSASPSDERKPDTPADQFRIPYGTAKAVSAQRLNWRKTQENHEDIARQPTITTSSVA